MRIYQFDRKFLFVIFLFFIIFNSCRNEDFQCHKYLNIDDAIQYFHRNPYVLADDLQFVYNDQRLNSDELKNIDVIQFGYDYGLNNRNEVQQIHLRDKNYKDDLLRIIISNYTYFPFTLSKIDPIRYSCDSLESILDLIMKIDQGEYDPRIDYRVGQDLLGDSLTFPIVSTCKFESLKKYSRYQLLGLIMTIQHSQKEIISFYYPYLVKAVKEGVFDKKSLALVTDRLLIRYGYSQIYGTQIDANTKQPFELRYPAKVDSLRSEIGLDSLKFYTAHFQ